MTSSAGPCCLDRRCSYRSPLHRGSSLLHASPLLLPFSFPLNIYSFLMAWIRLYQCGYMLSIKIFSLIFAMINLYSLFITALWILLKQNGLKKQIFIIFEFLWNLCQELWSSSTGWLRLRVFHEVAVKMFTGGVVIWKLECGWRTPIQDGLWLMEKKPQFLTGCQETSVLPHMKLFIGSCFQKLWI